MKNKEIDAANWLGYEVVGDTLFFGRMRPCGEKLHDIWYSVDLNGYTEEKKMKVVAQAVILSNAPQSLQSAQARNEMAEFAKIDDFEDVPLKTLDNSEQTDTNVAPRLEHIEGLEEALSSFINPEEVDGLDVVFKAARAYAAKMEKK